MDRRLIRFALIVLILAAGLAAQEGRQFFFIQLSDPQFGAFTADRDFVQETANYEFAVANINRLHPSFVVICGDLINKTGDPQQAAEYFRITAKMDPSIPVYAVAGNHDVGNEPSAETLAEYRKNFGPDYYSFRRGGIYGIVLDSSLIAAPGKVQMAADEQEAWLKAELRKANAAGEQQIVVFQHHSWFLKDPDEPNQYFNIPVEQRRRYLDLLKSAGVRYVFAGHYHRNAYARDENLEMITTGPVGRPLGDDPSGMRIIALTATGLEHHYYSFGNLPSQYPPLPLARGAR